MATTLGRTLGWSSVKVGRCGRAGNRVAPIFASQVRSKVTAAIDEVEAKLPLSERVRQHRYLEKILTSRVYDICMNTPLTHAHNLSKACGNNIYLKREDMQPVFSFKLRGAHNKIAHLTSEERQAGVIACSAGNHAQGVAMSAAHLGIDATIVMPVATPTIKVMGVQRHGARVVLHGSNFDEAKAECMRIMEAEGQTLIHPYDDPLVIAGQGTIGAEIVAKTIGDDVEAILCCVGGGGLLAGIAAYVKAVRPEIKVIGVESMDADAMYQSLKLGRRVELENVGLFADGAAVKVVGEYTFEVCQHLVDDMILVNTDEICAAIKDTFYDTRSIVEPAGALGVAGAKKYAAMTGCKGKTLVAITSGANMNFDRLRFVAERSDTSEVLLSCNIPERPGAFMKLYSKVFPRNVTEFSYRYSDDDNANIMMSFSAKDSEDLDSVVRAINAESNMTAADVTRNELAKLHARYMVGGHSHRVLHERLFRFEFPERPGALKNFLGNLSSDYNVSLFHYRNYGSDVGQVLVGIQVPPDVAEGFEAQLTRIGYQYFEETNNPIYAKHFK
eukprot:Clim_evm37s149 gene=Clim_evmTU37s149